MSVGIVFFGAAVWVSAWAVREVPLPDGGAVPPAPLVGKGGDNTGSYGLNSTHQRTRAALVATEIVLFTVIVSLGSVRACGLPLGGYVRRGT